MPRRTLQPKRRQVADFGQHRRMVKHAIERCDGDPLIGDFEDAECCVARSFLRRELARRQIVERVEVARSEGARRLLVGCLSRQGGLSKAEVVKERRGIAVLEAILSNSHRPCRNKE